MPTLPKSKQTDTEEMQMNGTPLADLKITFEWKPYLAHFSESTNIMVVAVVATAAAGPNSGV